MSDFLELELQIVVNCLMGAGKQLWVVKKSSICSITWVISLACLRVNVGLFINLMFYSLSHWLPIKMAFNFHVFVSFIVFLLSLIFSLYCRGKENHLTLCKSLKICLIFLYDLIIFSIMCTGKERESYYYLGECSVCLFYLV